MADERAEQDVAQQAVQALQRGLGDRLVAVVLFGSRARGDAREDSDWDLLVIARDLPADYLDRHFMLKRMLPDEIRGMVSIISKTPSEFEQALPPLYLDIALDGRLLHDTDDYAANRIELIRRLITDAGLERERTAAGDIWHVRSPASYRPLQWPENESIYANQ